MYDTILLPTDGGAGSRRAAEHAIDLARGHDAALHVFNVVESASLVGTEADPGALLDAFEEAGERTVDDLVTEAKTAGVPTVSGEVTSGTPHRAIRDYADEHDADLVVMGTRGRTGIDRYLLGSVTEKVVRTSEVPVLTVRASEEGFDGE